MKHSTSHANPTKLSKHHSKSTFLPKSDAGFSSSNPFLKISPSEHFSDRDSAPKNSHTHTTITSQSFLIDSNSSNPPKRKRGRPRKDRASDSNTRAPKSKGRPKKSSKKHSPTDWVAHDNPVLPTRTSLRQALHQSASAERAHSASRIARKETLSEVSDLDLDENFKDDTVSELELRHERKHGDIGSSADESTETEDEETEVQVAAHIPVPGRGVVTWSDYDSIGGSSSDEDNELDKELEELTALSEAVVGRDDGSLDMELAELWFEELGQDGDIEEDSGDETEDDPEDNEQDPNMLFVDSQAWDQFKRSNDMDTDDDIELEFSLDDENFKDGDTTDSLDSDDHVGLVRFGIEYDSEVSEDEPGNDLWIQASVTANLADVQPPTSTDLAVLKQQLMYNPASNAAEQLSPTKPPKKLKKKEIAPTPAMGTFDFQKSSRRSRSLFIDEGETVVSSPYVYRRKTENQVSSRARSDSRASTVGTSGTSTTEESVIGDIHDFDEPIITNIVEPVNLDFADILHAAFLDEQTTDDETEQAKKELDLNRWSKVPIGAFRSSTASQSSAQHFFTPAKLDDDASTFKSPSAPRNSHVLVPAPRSVIRAGPGAHSLSSTLASPGDIRSKRTIDRMLTSPLLLPAKNTDAHTHAYGASGKKQKRRHT